MIFSSDNWSGAHPAVAEALAREAGVAGAAYGNSEADGRVARHFAEIFEREVSVFFVGTGTAANALALAAFARPGGVILCHDDAHIRVDECGAPEFFATARLSTVPGAAGRMDLAALAAALDAFDPAFVHGGQPMAVSISQATEAGTFYRLEEIAAVAALAHGRGLPLHMDGARFANAAAALGASPADMTWRAGVDVLSFGATKNGCWCAEAILFFDPQKAAEFAFVHKRGGQLFSKTRFIAAQFEAYLKDGLWLRLAAQSNAMADRLRDGLKASATGARLAWPTQGNEVFAIVPDALIATARAAGAQFYDWPADSAADLSSDETMIRLVTSWNTTDEEVDSLLRIVGAAA